MKKHWELIKRLVSLFMAFMMTFTCLPLEVFAEEIGGTDIAIEEGASQLIEDNTSSEIHTHVYEDEMTAPACTEQGFTTHACECGDSYVDSYVEAKGHSYENGICTACGAEHPDLANFEGKIISILGDSISTFAGYIPVADGLNLEHLPRYPQDNLLTDVNETWWMQVISELDGKLGINDSWRGATVSGDKPVTTGTTGENAAMCNLTRIQNLGANGTPDVILFYGGTNDLAHVSKVGSFDPSSAPTVVDLTTKKWDNLADGYVHALLRLRHYYPDAQIVAMLPTYTTSYYSSDKLAQGNAVLAQICEHYGVPYVDLRECGITTADLPDGIHPDANGMDDISEAVIDTLLNECEVQSGENVVHSVKHNLIGAESSLSYYKGVTAGKAFVTTISGEELAVSVTMGGTDITKTAYANGVVTIAEVTDDIVITATGRVKTIYEDHLQQLPENLCCSTNLWSSLVSENTYYTGSAWGNVSGNSVYSITIPIAAGDQIWATSFQKSGTNGGSRNGIRLTWFDESGVLESVSPDNVYTEFSANGYLTAPEGVVAVNVVMWNGNESNEVYILNHGHTYTSGICTACGAEDPDYVPTFLYLNEAVAYLREQMKARIGTVTLRIADMELTAEQGNTMLSDAIAHTGVPTEGDYFRRNMGSKSCSVVTGEDANGVYSDVTFNFNWYTTAEMEAEVDAAVEALLDELNLWSASDYEKIVGVYDWISENIEYDHDRYDEEGSTIEHTTYAAIVNRLAVCQGYASLYYRLLLELGVDCRVISGLAGLNGGESHAWNIVKLEGKYYNADPTWDADLKGHYRYFLCTMENFKEHVRDDEFDSESFHTQYPMSLVPYVVNATASGSVNGAIEWVLDGETGTLTVAGTGAIPSYRYGSAPWYPYRESVKSIVVSEGITEVGERAFYWCTNCTSVTLPESLVAIREYGFNNLRALQEIKLPSKLTTIEFCAFSECVGLQSIVIPNSVTTIGSSAFSNCYALTSATLSAGMTTIPDSMFFGDRNLKKVALQNGLTTIGDTAFADCGITSFTIPSTVTSIGVAAFAGCRSNNSFTVKAGNTAYKAVNGVLFTYDGKTLVSYPAGKFGNSYAVPEGTVTIDHSAFSDAYMLKTITFASSVRTIQHSAFAHCDVLASITFPSGITSIGDSALRECDKLTSVTFENPDVVLGPSVFADCDGLVSIQLPTRLKELSYGMFSGCAKLKNVTIPSTVTKMGGTVFSDCDSLVSITVPGNVKSLGQQAFDFCNNLETIIFEEGVESLGWICIRNAPSLKKVVLPSSITTIEKENFEECPNVVVYVNCGSVAHRYAQSNGVAASVTHSYETTVTAPTCTDRGYTTHTCAVCSNSYKDAYVSALGHSYGNWEIVKESTCTEQGSERRDCTRCDAYETQVIEVTEHPYKAVVTPPTCTEQGYTTHTCSVCDSSYVDSYVNAKGHSYGEWTVTTAPTCTEQGTERRDCKNCDHFETRSVAAKGHSYKSVVTAPTCTEQGYTTHTCTVCGNSYVDGYVNAMGHSYDAWSVTTAPTCTEKGTERRDCKNCDHFETRTVAAKGHTEVIDEAVAPTCTETGLTEGKHCSVCDVVLVKQEVVAAKGHDYKSVVTAPTCTERGYTTHTCTVCGDSYVDSYVNAKGHSYGEWSVITAPTCTEQGVERRDCKNCGHSETRTVAAKGHSEVIDEAVEPTCTETGLTEGKHCSVCDAVLVEQEVVAKSGHSYGAFVPVEAVPESGHYQSCSCGEETALKSHEYGDDRTCDICSYVLAPLRCDAVLSQTYTGEAITPAVKVYYGEKLLELDKDYTVSYSNNINVPAKDALESELPTITICGKGYYIDTVSVTFTIAKAMPALGNVSVVGTVKDTADPTDVVLTGTNTSVDGTFALTDEKLLANVTTYHWTFTPTDTANYNVVTGEVEIDVLDTVAPSVVVTVEENQWRTTLNTITFGLFFKETKTVTIEYADNESGSGIDEMLYYVSDKAVADVANIPWETYSKSFNIDPDGTFVIYAKAVDKDGNSAMVNSDGIVLDASAPLLKDIVDGGIYYGDLTITASDALAGVKTVTVDGDTVVLENGQYTIAADNSEHTVVVTDKAGNTQQYTVHVMKMYTVSGTVTSYLTGDVTIELLRDGAVKYTTTSATGTGVAYVINDVTAGTYIMRVSKENHVTREYEVVVADADVSLDAKICPKGDVNLDGEVNADDLTALARHVAKIETLTDDYALLAADVDDNGFLSADDLTKLARYVAKIIPSL